MGKQKNSPQKQTYLPSLRFTSVSWYSRKVRCFGGGLAVKFLVPWPLQALHLICLQFIIAHALVSKVALMVGMGTIMTCTWRVDESAAFSAPFCSTVCANSTWPATWLHQRVYRRLFGSFKKQHTHRIAHQNMTMTVTQYTETRHTAHPSDLHFHPNLLVVQEEDFVLASTVCSYGLQHCVAAVTL